MTRGHFSQIGINASVSLVRLMRPTEPPRHTAVLDLFGLAGRFWGKSTRQTAVIYSTIRSLQDWFPRSLSGKEGVVKPGKETRIGQGKTIKQQHLSGAFSLDSPTPAYLGARLAMAELVDDQRVVPGTDDIPDVEFLNTGGEGEMGAFLAYEAELEREGVKPGFFQPAKVVAAAAKTDDDDFVPLDPTEQPLSPSELFDFATALSESFTPDGATAPVVEPEPLADQPWTVHQFVLDGDFLLGPARQVIQRWEIKGDVLLLEVVDVEKSVKKAGEAVKNSFLFNFHAERSAARQRRANGVKGDTPLFDSIISNFDHAVPTEHFEDVAFGVEALTGDYGAKLAEGVGPVTLAKLGILSNRDWALWQRMVAERATWAESLAFHRSIIAHFVHPAASPPSAIFSESLDANDDSKLEYSIWVSPRPHSHRNVSRSLDALDLPYRDQIDLAHSSSTHVQSLLWRVLTEEVCIIPPTGWTVSSGAPTEPSTFVASVAGSGIPGTPRKFPILASNLKPTHLELLGLNDETRAALGPRSTVPTWRTNLLIKQMAEEALESREKAEVAAEAEEELEEMRRDDESNGLYYVLSEEANANLAAAKERTGQAWRARRRKRWLDRIAAFLQHVQACCPTIDIGLNFEIVHIDAGHVSLIGPEGNQLCTISPVFNVELLTDKLSGLTPAEQDKLLPGGSFDVSSVAELLTKESTRGRLLRRVFTEVSKTIGVPIVDDQAERLSVVASSGFAVLRKPSILSKILSLPRYRINKDIEGYERVLRVATWFGVRKFIDFAVEQKKLGLFNFDRDDLATLAPLLQKWVNHTSGRAHQKPHIIAALNSIGFASRASLWDALVPTIDRAQKALAFFRGLKDHTWVVHRDVLGACTWIQAGRLKDYLDEAADAALYAAVPPDTVVEELSDEERKDYLGGEVVYCEDPRVGGGSRRAWWRAVDGEEGDLLEEELQEDERRGVETRNAYLDEALAMLRSWPDSHFLTYNDLEHYAMKVDSQAAHSQPGAENIFNLLKNAACTRYNVDPEAERDVMELMGGRTEKVIGAHARGYRLRWHSARPGRYPSTLPTPMSLRKRDAAAASLDEEEEKPKRATRSSSRASSSAATASKGKNKAGGSSRSTRSGK